MARLLSVNVGLPRDIPWQGRTVHTGIWKTPAKLSLPIAVRIDLIDKDRAMLAAVPVQIAPWPSPSRLSRRAIRRP
jgi:hypothetical protein